MCVFVWKLKSFVVEKMLEITLSFLTHVYAPVKDGDMQRKMDNYSHPLPKGVTYIYASDKED